MAEKKRDVIFRRIGGRIVPIRLSKKRQKELEQGAGLTAAGVTAGLGLGFLSGKSHKSSSDIRQMAFKFGRGHTPIGAGLEGVSFGARLNLKSKRIAKAGRLFKSAANVGAAAFVGAGVDKIISAFDPNPKDSLFESVAGEAAGLTAFAAIRSGEAKGRGVRFRRQAASALRRAKSEAPSKILKGAKFAIRSKFKF